MNTTALTEEQIRELPKVSLHDHLDGGLRPETILDLAQQSGIDLPGGAPTDSPKPWASGLPHKLTRVHSWNISKLLMSP